MKSEFSLHRTGSSFLPLFFSILLSQYSLTQKIGLQLDPSQSVLFGESLQGEGHKLIWNPTLAALRAGNAGFNNAWDTDSVGLYSVGFGNDNLVEGQHSMSWGMDNRSRTSFSTSWERTMIPVGRIVRYLDIQISAMDRFRQSGVWITNPITCSTLYSELATWHILSVRLS